MMNDLFADEAQLVSLRIPDANVSFISQFPLALSNLEVFQRLREETSWLHEEVRVYGKLHLQPRLTAWFGDPGRSYRYSGTTMEPAPWTKLLMSMRDILADLVKADFNSVLLNLYRDHNDRMGFHSDDEPSLGEQPTIASLSYGATRTLIFKHKCRAELEARHIKLTDGSLLLMKGDTQRNWKHGINREPKPCGPRINLTFRNVLS